MSAVSELLQELPAGDELVSRRTRGLTSNCSVTAGLKRCKIKSVFRGHKYLIKGRKRLTGRVRRRTLKGDGSLPSGDQTAD